VDHTRAWWHNVRDYGRIEPGGYATINRNAGVSERLRERFTSMAESSVNSAPTEAVESHEGALGDRLNWLRAGVLGANDGLVSTAGIVVG